MAGQGSRWAEPAVAAVPHLPVPSPVLSALAFPAWEAQAGLVAPLRQAVHVQHGLRELLDLFCFSSDTPLPSRCWCLPSAEPNPSPAAAKSQTQTPSSSPAWPQFSEQSGIQFSGRFSSCHTRDVGWPQNQSNTQTSRDPPHTTKPGIPPAWGVLRLLLFPGHWQRAQIQSHEQETARTLRANLFWERHPMDPPISVSSSCSRRSYWCWNLHLGMFQLLSVHFLGTRGAPPALQPRHHHGDILG